MYYDAVGRELRAGRKRSHWMWFVFPQLRGLGRSATAITSASGRATRPAAYLDHDVLGPRLRRVRAVGGAARAVDSAEAHGLSRRTQAALVDDAVRRARPTTTAISSTCWRNSTTASPMPQPCNSSARARWR